MSGKNEQSELTESLGRRVRSLREVRGLSLRKTASELGVSPSALSQLERGEVGVSMKRLQLIADYFDVTIVDLIAPDEGDRLDTRPLVVKSPHTRVRSIARGDGCAYQLIPGPPRAGLQPVLITLAPGGGYVGDELAHRGQEIALVLWGSVALAVGEDRLGLEQGDLAFFDSEKAHAFENLSNHGTAIVFSVANQSW